MIMEIWKDIAGFEGYYQVSNFGNVRSVERVVEHKKRICIKCGGILLKQSKSSNKYLSVSLSKDGKHKVYSVHRLVADAFLQNTENKPQVNHIDGNKLNNNVNNLEWCTISENIKHSVKTGLQQRIPNKSIRKEKKVYQFDLQGNLIAEFESVNEATRKTGISASSISECACGKYSKSNGYVWKYNL